ncbi:PfkB domain protein [uncultured Paludibacter sp.]|nr:PfkB domain protein [uncultured Paludibacter sp.]
MKKILGIGNALTDILFRTKNDEILTQLQLKKGSMQLVDDVKSKKIISLFKEQLPVMATGGSASNAINGATKLGNNGGFIGKIGNDEIGKFFAQNSLENGVEPFLKISETSSGNCTVIVSADGERTLCTFLGAASELLAEDLDSTIFFEYDIFHIEGYLVQNHELIRTALKMAKKADMLVSIDLASFNTVEENRDFLYEMIDKYVDITFANEDEATAFSQSTPEDALRKIGELCDIAVVKLGRNGSLVKKAGEIYKIDAYQVDCVDSTGAGDMYAAGFLHGLSKNYPLDVCGKIGSLVSAKVVEVMGAKLTESVWMEIYREIENILKEKQ